MRLLLGHQLRIASITSSPPDHDPLIDLIVPAISTDQNRDESDGEEAGVDVGHKEGLRIGVVRKDELISSSIGLLPSKKALPTLTLARKLDAVHSTTVTRSNKMPRVFLAMPPNIGLAEVVTSSLTP